MKNFVLLMSTAFLAACCSTQTSQVPAFDVTNIDTSYLLNEDFYEWATHGWQTKNPLKPEFSRYGAFDVLGENNQIQLNDLFSGIANAKTEMGTIEQKIADLYRMGLDSTKLNEDGIKPIKEQVNAILAVDREGLPSLIAYLHKNVCNPFFSSGVAADLANCNINTLYISQSGLGMGDRDYYLDSEHAGKRDAYATYLKTVFLMLGINQDASQNVIDLETRMAEKFRSRVELRDVQANYNPTERAIFTKEYCGFDWDKYFGFLGLPEFTAMVVEQPQTIQFISSLLKDEPIENIRYYLISRYVTSAASFLSDDIYSAYFEFYGKTLSGQEQPKPRWKRAMSIPNGVLSEAVGQMYVAKYFPQEQKDKVLQIVKNLQTALGEHIMALDWMSDNTKAKAIEKLNAFTVKIGYPDKWKDYSTLTINPELSYWENVINANNWESEDNYAKLGKEVDREEWFMSPQTVNAYYNPTTNEICFPAAILQPPFYNPNADDAINYGAIGVVIGHEMTHGFDDQGRQFDKDGNLSNWWTDEDAQAFNKKAEILVNQFDSVEVLPGLHANGKLCLGENIADQGGLRVAYTAYHNSLNGVIPEPIDGFTADQRFYLGYATVWAQNIRKEEIERRTKTDVHSIGKNRVNVTLKNIQTFYDAFNITEGAMFLPQEDRVTIW